jgi:hypothetical protein
MVWEIKHKDKELRVKTCFALFPIKIDNYLVWLSPYYKTWDLEYIGGGFYDYLPHRFINEKEALEYVKEKEEHKTC